MWFKNIRLLEFETKITQTAEQLIEQLERLTFHPCPKTLPLSYGWVPPLDEADASLIFAQGECLMLRLKIEEKVLPPAVVREQLSNDIKQIEQKTGRKIYKDEKERLKDEVYQTLLTKAFSKSSYVNGYIDLTKNWLIVDAASDKKLAFFVSSLQKCIEQQAFAPEIKNVPRVLTQWLTESNYPSSLCFADAGVLTKIDESSSVARFKNQDLLSKKVQTFLEEGSQATQLMLEWADQIRFTIKENFSLSSLRFLEAVKDLAQDGMRDTNADRFATDFLIMAETLRKFLSELMSEFHDPNAILGACTK